MLFISFSRLRAGPILISLLLALITPLHCLTSEPLSEALSAHFGDSALPAAGIRGSTISVVPVLLGTGFHRTLSYTVTLHETPSAVEHCQVVLLQPLPSAVYANAYELQNAAEVGQGAPVRLFGPVDVESVAADSTPTVLAIYANSTLLACNKMVG
jgi:hypothetical protein